MADGKWQRADGSSVLHPPSSIAISHQPSAMTPVMDLRQLEILQAIAETGSFTACGRKLHVSQSAISRQILLLEDELGEPLLLVTTPTHPLARRRTVAPHDLAALPFVLFEVGSATRRVIDNFFASESIEPTVVMDTENVEIIKAMVKTGLGIGIVPYQAIAREVKAGQLFCSRIEGHELVRETGWVYARANRVPRMIEELLTAFQAVKDKLRLAPPPARVRARPNP